MELWFNNHIFVIIDNLIIYCKNDRIIV